MPLLETTVVTDDGVVVESSERKLYTLAELKDSKHIEDEPTDIIKSRVDSAYDTALSWMIEMTMEYSWWDSALDCEVDFIAGKYGITYKPKEVSFDLDRGSYFCFGKTTDIDERVFLRKAGIDLRTKAAKAMLGRLVLGERHSYNTHNWIGFYEYECLPDYIEDMQPGITEKLEECLRDAQNEMLTNLRKEQEYLTSDEYLDEMAEINDYTFDKYGKRA
jgi:hypothetical protein